MIAHRPEEGTVKIVGVVGRVKIVCNVVLGDRGDLNPTNFTPFASDDKGVNTFYFCKVAHAKVAQFLPAQSLEKEGREDV